MLAITGLIPMWSANAGLVQGPNGSWSQTLTYSGTPNFDTSLYFDKYNGSGTVTQILFQGSTTISGYNLTVTNNSSGEARLLYYDFGAKDYSTIQPIDQTEMVAVYDSKDYGPDGRILAVAESLTFAGKAHTNTFEYYVDAADFSKFIVPVGSGGTFEVTEQARQYTTLSQEGGLTSTLSPGNTSGSVTVTYMTVPEPGTVTLLGGILLGGLALRRKFHRTAK